MARKPRLHYPGASYHAILRGNARQDIFFDAEDRCRFFLLVQEGIERYGHRVLSFCLMTNHVHLAIQVGNVPLSRIMQNLSFRYTRWINMRRNRMGHLFQGRYKAILVDADTHLLELIAYLHLNPVRAGLTEKPEDYPWSSHRAYLGTESVPWLSSDYVLGQFSPNLELSRWQFAEFVAERVPFGHREEFYGKGSMDSRIIGEDSFVENVLMESDHLPARKPSLEEVLETVEKINDLQKGELSAPGKKRKLSEARGLAAWAVLEVSDASLTDLAKRLGRDVSTISAASRRFDERRKQDLKLRGKIELLKKELGISKSQA
ncbi:MAG: transposase [Deltaproteobacteria bacterium]|nr:transposase [Deltaproteobacteria bacterium]